MNNLPNCVPQVIYTPDEDIPYYEGMDDLYNSSDWDELEEEERVIEQSAKEARYYDLLS